MNLQDRKWKEFRITEIFSCIQRGKRQKAEDRMTGDTAYYSASIGNNGLTDFISNPSFIFKNNAIIYSTFGDAYFVPSNFSTSDEITILYSKKLNKYNALFIVQALQQNQSKYCFGRKAFSNKITKDKIMLPIDTKGEPDYKFMEKYIKERETRLKNQYKEHIKSLVDKVQKEVCINKEWQDFYISKIFEIKAGKRLTKAHMKSGNIPFIGATDSNNGITNFVSNENTSTDKGVLGVNYNGSVVETFYHPYKCTFSDDVKRFSTKEIKGNKYIYLFLKNAILKQKCKYMYGYKFNENRMVKQKIMLPVNSKNEPDYEFMHNYMLYLEQKKILEYLEYINE